MKNLNVSDLKSNLFSGQDSFGRNYELAIKNGLFFHRTHSYNGYGVSPGKWEQLSEFSGEFYIEPANEFYPERERLKWGWGFDAIGSVNSKLKVPIK